MSKIKNYDLALYKSIEDGLKSVMAPHKFVQLDKAITMTYTPKGYECVMAFLCVNDIPHTFTFNPVNSKLRARVVMVTWTEPDDTEKNMAWWEKDVSTDCYLVRFEENWADEADFYAFALFTADEYNNWCHVMIRLQEAMNSAVFEYCFGTNEYQEYETFKEFVDCFTIKIIPAEHAAVIRGAFDINTYYGNFPGIDDLNCYIEDMEKD